MDGRWLVNHRPKARARVRLFCLSFAGGGASVYHGWQQLAPDHLDVCAVELPGRGRRIQESPFTRFRPLVRAMATALEPALDRPFALFGHSMGGLLAFELARTLHKRGRPVPEHLFVSGVAAPGVRSVPPIPQDASDARVRQELRRLGGTPPEVLEDDELMALTLPVMRADYSVLNTYEYQPARPLEVPITVFGGTGDRVVPRSSLHGWRRESTAGARLRMFHGDHFFLREAAAEIVGTMRETLDGVATGRELSRLAAG